MKVRTEGARSALAVTRATYDAIADRYVEQTRDRRGIRTWLDAFSRTVPAGGLVVDVGCGPGFDAALLRARGFRVVGLDRSLAMLRVGRREFPGAFVLGDMRRLPFLRGRADGLWANASILHVPRARVLAVLRELHRTLAPRGVFFVSVKRGRGAAWDTRRYGETAPRWFVYWDAAKLDAALGAAGFTIVRAWSAASATDEWLARLARRAGPPAKGRRLRGRRGGSA